MYLSMLTTMPCLGRTTSKCRGNLPFNIDEKEFYTRASWHMYVTTVKFLFRKLSTAEPADSWNIPEVYSVCLNNILMHPTHTPTQTQLKHQHSGQETTQTPVQAFDWKPPFYCWGSEVTMRHWWGCPGADNRDRQRNNQITQPNLIFRQIFREISICFFLKWVSVE